MTRLIVLIVILLACAVFFAVSPNEPSEERVDTTSTTVLSDRSVPSLPDNFASFTDGTRRAAQNRSKALRVKPTRSGLFREAMNQEAGAWGGGGTLPPCWVFRREDPNHDLTVYNGGHHYPVGYEGSTAGSTASGKWQVLRSTWRGFRGYVNAADAPWTVQDEFARQLWDGGAGCSHWAAC